MHIESELKLGFRDVLIRPKRSTLSSRAEVSLTRTFQFKHGGGSWSGIPIIASNMDTIGTFAMATALSEFGLMTAIHKHYQATEWSLFMSSVTVPDFIAVSTGMSERDFEGLSQVLAAHKSLRFICIDVANGYTQRFVDYLKRVRAAFPDKVIIAGNVVTGEMTEELILSGADIVKAGIGPGSVCTTRIKTGVGYPQLSTIIECADAAHGLGGLVISDGGCTSSGDIAKAFGAGADFVMLGGMLAGHDECGGEVFEREGKRFLDFYGMSSAVAMEKHSGGVADYRASEGKCVSVPYRGPVAGTIRDILGGVRSACTYVGAARLKELSKRTTFIRVREQENTIFS